MSDTELPDPRAAIALNGVPRVLTFGTIGAIGCDRFLGGVNDRWARRAIVWVGVGCGVLYAIAMIAWYQGIAETDVAMLAPLFATRTIFTTISAVVFLREACPGVVYVAIVMIVVGAVLISLGIRQRGSRALP